MTRLEKLGHNVLFVDPPINTGRLFMRQILQGKWSPLKLLTKTQKMGNVLVFSPLDFSPAHEKHAELHAKAIQNATKKFFNPDRNTILWIYHVEIAGLDQYLKYIEHDFLVYDCVDNYAGFPKYSTPEKKDAINKAAELGGIPSTDEAPARLCVIDPMEGQSTGIFGVESAFRRISNIQRFKLSYQ